MLRTEREAQPAKKGTCRGTRQEERGGLSWKQRGGGFGTWETEVTSAQTPQERAPWERTGPLDLASQEPRSLFQSSCSEVLRQELECRGGSEGSEGGGRARVHSLLKA